MELLFRNRSRVWSMCPFVDLIDIVISLLLGQLISSLMSQLLEQAVKLSSVEGSVAISIILVKQSMSHLPVRYMKLTSSTTNLSDPTVLVFVVPAWSVSYCAISHKVVQINDLVVYYIGLGKK